MRMAERGTSYNNTVKISKRRLKEQWIEKGKEREEKVKIKRKKLSGWTKRRIETGRCKDVNKKIKMKNSR